MFVIKHKNIFIGATLLLVAVSLFAIFSYGLNFGIDFKGGSIIELEYKDKVADVQKVKEALKPLNLGEILVQPFGDKGLLVRLRDVTEAEHNNILRTLSPAEEKRFSSIGPVLGSELRSKSILALSFVVLGIVLYIAFAFRGVSHPVKSWKYGLVAIVTLMHDVIVPTGLFAFLGKLYSYEVDLLFVAALLAILGFSIHDTIVVFDRIRENLKIAVSKDFSETVGRSISETIVRSINTSLTTLLVLLSLYFFGGDSTRNFALVLSVGIIAGTYSSIFLASPLLVLIESWQRRRSIFQSRNEPVI